MKVNSDTSQLPLPSLPNKNTGEGGKNIKCPVKYEYQIDSEYFFQYKYVSHLFKTCLNNLIYLKFKVN